MQFPYKVCISKQLPHRLIGELTGRRKKGRHCNLGMLINSHDDGIYPRAFNFPKHEEGIMNYVCFSEKLI